MELFGVFLIGLVAGVVGSISSGGGIITIPYLLFFGYTPVEVIGTTRIASLCGGIASVYRYHKGGRINWRLVKKLALPSALAGVAGPFILPMLNPDLIVAIIGFTLLALAAWMLLFKNYCVKDNKRHKKHKVMGLAMVTIAMLYAVMFGAGGGAIVINLMVLFFGMKLNRAAATGMTIWLFGTFVGSVFYLFRGDFIPELTVAGGRLGHRWYRWRSLCGK